MTGLPAAQPPAPTPPLRRDPVDSGTEWEPAVAPELRPADFRWTIVPHTHWDREWYQPFEAFRLRLAGAVDELLDVLESDERFAAFSLDGQSVILEDYLEVREDREPRLRALLEAGRIATGPSYVLPDEFLAPQEALVRNLLVGTKVARRLGARPTRVGYQPDPFGHVAQLPQVLRGFGLDAFVFWRGLGEDGERVGSVFEWRAPDGSGVLAIRQLGGYGNASQLGRWGRDGRDHAMEPDAWARVAADRVDRYLDRWCDEVRRDGIAELLLCNGSDHEPAWRPLPDLVDAMRAAHPGLEVSIGTYDDYVTALGVPPGRPGTDAPLPVVAGELRWGRDAHILRGIDSVRMPLKQANDRATLALLAAESLASLAQLRRPATARERDPLLPPETDQRVGLERAWKLLLRNQPHDSISGCSIDVVHREMATRTAGVEALAARIGRVAAAELAGVAASWSPDEPQGRPDTVTVWNPLPNPRRVLVEVPVRPALRSRPLEAEVGPSPGTVVLVDVRGDAALVPVDLEGFGGRAIRLRPRAAREPELATADHVPALRAVGSAGIENERYRVEADADGTFTVTDRSNARTLSGLGRFEDVADRGDEYTFCPIEPEPVGIVRWHRARHRVRVRAHVAELEITTEGHLPARLDARRRARIGRVALRMRTVVRLVAGIERVEVTTTLVNRARDHRLRLRFPVLPGAKPVVRAEGHFAVLRRRARPVVPSRPEAWAELPRPEHHTTGFVAAGPLVVIGHGLPEYEAIEPTEPSSTGRDLELAVTLLRCVGWLSRDDLTTRPGGAGLAVETPDAQCLGEHTFRYDLLLDGDRPDPALVRASADARWPVVVGPAPRGELPAAGVAAIAVRGDVAFAALKPAETGRGAVLRLYNPGIDRAPIAVDGDVEPWRIRLDESPLADSAVPETVGPFEILTLRLEPTSVEVSAS